MKSKVLNLGQNNPGDSTGWALSSWAAAERDWSSCRTRGIGASSASGMTQDQGKVVFPQVGGRTCLYWGDNPERQILTRHKGKSFHYESG